MSHHEAADPTTVPSPPSRVLASYVVRGALAGASHGGLFIADFEQGSAEPIMEWRRGSIEGLSQGGDRGLRGIAIAGDRVFVAASREVYEFTPDFTEVAAYTCPYSRGLHEVHLVGSSLWVSSTRFDSVLEFDIDRRAFTRGVHLDLPPHSRTIANAGSIPTARWFDPTAPGGPEPRENSSLHLNCVHVEGDAIYAGCRRLPYLLRVSGNLVEPYCTLPLGHHNARPFEGGVLVNDTSRSFTAIADRSGNVSEVYRSPQYDVGDLVNHDRSTYAIQGYSRGLVATDSHLVAGSSPATVSLFERGRPDSIATVRLTNNVLFATHGLATWPF